jgi:hypothetical protein
MDQGADASGEASGQRSGEHSPDGRWVSYDELGRIRGIGRESAVKLVQRKRWRRVRGNDGEARISVPLDWLAAAKPATEDTSPEHTPQPSPDTPRIMAALETAIVALTVRAERAEAEADRAIAALQIERERGVGERARADRAEAQVDHLRQATKTTERVLREAEAALTAERSAREKTAGEATHLQQAVETAEAAVATAREAQAKAEAARDRLLSIADDLAVSRATTQRLRGELEQAQVEARRPWWRRLRRRNDSA